MHIGIAGVGRMGAAIALRLIEAGHQVTVWNRTVDKTAPLVGAGAKVATTPSVLTDESDAIITCWRLKYEVGFWRPFQAIHAADTDGNPATAPDPSWTPLIANPPYSDYVSGHGCLTSPTVQIIRRTLGENTPLRLHSYSTLIQRTDRDYRTLGAIEHDAFHARIWGGLHFRTAMEDAYAIGHTAADQVLHRLH